jgi:stage III sporulation protein AE
MRRRYILWTFCLGMALFLLWTGPARSEGNDPVGALAEEQLDSMDFREIQKYWERIVSDYGGFLPESARGTFKDFVKNAEDFSVHKWTGGILRFLFQEFLADGWLLATLVMLTIFSLFLQSLQNAFDKTTISKVAYSIVFMVLLVIALNSFHIAVQYVSGTIEQIIHFTLSFVPLLLALMATAGGVISTGFFHPFILFLANVSSLFVGKIILPLMFVSALLSIASTLTEHYKATQLASLLRNWSMGLLGIFMTVFLSIVSVQGTAVSIADGVAVRTVKFVTGNFIPVIGRMFTDAADTVLSASSLLKNTIGIAGAGMILLLTMFPAIKILMIAFIYKLAAALLQPLGGGLIITCLDVISKNVLYLFAALGIVALMFFLSLTIIIIAGNFTLMVR